MIHQQSKILFLLPTKQYLGVNTELQSKYVPVLVCCHVSSHEVIQTHDGYGLPVESFYY